MAKAEVVKKTKPGLIQSLQNDPVWSPPLEQAVRDVRDMRDDFNDYVNRILRKRQRHGIIKGAPGTGKSYTISALLKARGLREGTTEDRGRYDYTIIKGSLTSAKLHVQLYHHRQAGKTLILDDCRNAEHDIDCLTALNSAMDTTNPTVTRDRMNNIVDDGVVIPNQFTFKGSIIIVSNLFGDNARVGGVRATRFKSIQSRTQGFTVGTGDRQSVMAHILDLAEHENLFPDASDEQIVEVFTWAVERLGKFKEISIRHMMELMDLRTDTALKDWTRLARRVMLKTADELEVA
jgi:hypothetical protein